MHDLGRMIAEWRRTVVPNVGRKTADELENHLRENVAQLVRSGITEAEAFQRAVKELGSASEIASEFQKLEQSTWLPVKVVLGFGVLALVAAFILFTIRFDVHRTSLLLAGHVLTITFGYVSTFLVGALGICFVGQRSFSDFSPWRLRALTRITFILSCGAAITTVAGIILGMFWAKGAWGRYWGWDIKEVGGLVVIVWQLCFLSAHLFASQKQGAIVASSILGNIIVGLAWFGANRLDAGPAYGAWLLLFAALALNFMLFLAGFAPAGWLRRQLS